MVAKLSEKMTQWTIQCSSAGRDVSDIKLHEVCWQGWNDWHLRLLSAGHFLTGAFCRRVSDVVFPTMKHMKQKKIRV